MELSTLMHWRRLVPGAMFAAVFAPALLPWMDRVVESQVHSGSADYLKAITIALFLVMGHVYDAANIRWKLHGRDEVMRDEIIPRLKNALASAGVADLEVEIWDNAGKNWGLLLQRLVDGDQTLIVIGKRIYDAGFNWSSFIDGAIILLYGGLLGVAGYLVLGEPYLIAYYLVLACLGFFALASIPSQSKKHRKLCVDQQEHIRYFCRDRLVEEFRKGLHA